MHLTGSCGVCMRVCSFSLSSFLFSLHSDGSYVRYFFYTWPCLFGRTYQRRLVCASLPLPAFLPVWSSLVWSNACRQPCVFLFFPSFFLSFLFLSHDRHGWIVPFPSYQFFTPLPLSVSVFPAPPPPLMAAIDILELAHHSPEIPQTASCLWTCISVWGTFGPVWKVEQGEMLRAFVRVRRRMRKEDSLRKWG